MQQLNVYVGDLGFHTTHCHSDRPHFAIKKIENGKVDLKIHPYLHVLAKKFPNLIGLFPEGL